MRFYPRLHWLRGFLALSVVASHLEHLVSSDVDTQLVRCGVAAVPVFFVLSGFVMFRTVWSAPSGFGPALGFLTKRLLRIFPAYWFFLGLTCLFIVCGGVTWDHAESPQKDWAAGWLLLTQLAHPALPMGVSWSLIFELIFYYILVFPVVNRVIGAIALLIYFSWSILICQWVGIHIYGLSSICALFLAGLLLGKLEPRLPKNYAIWMTILLAGLILELSCVVLDFSLYGLIERLAAVLVVTGVLGLEVCRPPTFHGVFQRALGFLGTISFSLYVGHTIVQSVLARMSGPPTLWTAILFVTFPVLVAAGSFAWIETPAIKLAHKLDRRFTFDQAKIERSADKQERSPSPG